eukprot:TRINITY_DN27402_c0_g1_i1.p1 TRINITY_DN27402_c0_g1~~TRINITY_DN27402_c0_g1_i1.p1  ORF type:complete len:376 (+),score=71.53 TRINITY_DN27402_c0_g1_i1:95-1222(+)
MAAPSALRGLLRLLLSGALGSYLALKLLGKRVAKKRAITNDQHPSTHVGKLPLPKKVTDCGELDLRRKWAIVTGGGTDHAGEVCIVPGKQDLSQTIFKELTGVKAAAMKGAVCIELYWSDAAVQRITRCFAAIPRAPDHNQGILEFMETECNFAVEHADGSFMDHLQFCYEYGHAHYKQKSPRVLFLHSIMGVGTNVFPMTVDKEPKLRTMLTDEEYLHVQAFPSVLRLLYTRQLLAALTRHIERLDNLKSISFNRVLDNKAITLTASQFWVQLNYQICHQLDFLPASNWIALKSNAFLSVFIDLFNFLKASGKLEAELNFDLRSGETSNEGLPLTLGSLIAQATPEGLAKFLAIKQMKDNSKQIGHSLDYQLQW